MADPYAPWAGATVILQDGKRLGWKVQRGAIPAAYEFTDRYFGGFSRGECSSESRLFDPPYVSPGTSDVVDAAVAWCATFPTHEREGGSPPERTFERRGGTP